MKKRLLVVGCTGSVGRSLLSVCSAFPERFEVLVLAAKSSVKTMESLALSFRPEQVILSDEGAATRLRGRLEGSVAVLGGLRAMEEAACHPDIDHVVIASSGTDALPVLMTALRCGKEVSLANKESIVVGAPWVLPLVQGAHQLRPLDSEHNALWQCLLGRRTEDVGKVYLTASGGPFRTWTEEELSRVTPSMALRHPVWDMGAKLTVDSATLMNKGIEIMEAMSLFSLPLEKVEAVLSPDPFVHGLVQFADGTCLMAASEADMQIPCATALFHPERPPRPMVQPRELRGTTISFDAPDERRFPCLRLAREAAAAGGAAPPLLVGADEVAVNAFLAGAIAFTRIPKVVDAVLTSFAGSAPKSLDESLAVLDEGRRSAARICGTIASGTHQGDRWQ